MLNCFYEVFKIFNGFKGDPRKNGVDFFQISDEGLILVEVGVGGEDKSQITKAITAYKSKYGIVISNKTSKIKK